MSIILLPGQWCHLAGNGETVIVPFNLTRWRHQCLEFNVGVYQKQEVFLEFNVCVSQKQEPKALVLYEKYIDHDLLMVYGKVGKQRFVFTKRTAVLSIELSAALRKGVRLKRQGTHEHTHTCVVSIGLVVNAYSRGWKKRRRVNQSEPTGSIVVILVKNVQNELMVEIYSKSLVRDIGKVLCIEAIYIC